MIIEVSIQISTHLLTNLLDIQQAIKLAIIQPVIILVNYIILIHIFPFYKFLFNAFINLAFSSSLHLLIS